MYRQLIPIFEIKSAAMPKRKLSFACDLKDNSALIKEYKNYHTQEGIWPEITKSLMDAGIVDMQIYLTGNRLFMTMEVDEEFSLERKARMDTENQKVQDWEELMWKYQQAIPWAKPGEKWVRMEEIFSLNG